MFIIYDAGNIFYHKTNLQNELSLVKELYLNNEQDLIDNYLTKKELKIEYIEQDKLITIVLKEDMNFLTPGINNIFENEIKEEITILKED